MIWKLNSTAHKSSSQSLLWMLPKPSFMHSRYSPTTAMAMLTHSCALPLRPRNRPNTGTSTTYMAVRKPAFAVEGSSVMPSCCAALARNSSVPHISPAFSSSLRSAAVLGLPSGLPCRWCKASNALTVGISTSTAIQLRPARKENAPMPEPALCATKAVPQIRAHSISSIEFFVWFVIRQCPPPSAGRTGSTGWNHTRWSRGTAPPGPARKWCSGSRCHQS